MEISKTKRGRPPKDPDQRKAEFLEIRVETADKQVFQDAAKLAGLDLSAWVRARLRSVARRELKKAGLSAVFSGKVTAVRSGSRG